MSPDEVEALRAENARLEREAADLRAELHRQQRRHRFILDAALEGFHLVSTDGRILECNPAFAAALGYERDELLRMRIPAIDPRPSPLLSELTRDVLARRAVRFRTQHLHKDGRLIDVEVSLHFVRLDGEEFFAAFSHPITEQIDRERAQEAVIRELSTPILPLAPGVLCAPLVGRIDRVRAEQILERLLAAVSAQSAATVLLDVTGVPSIDADIAAALLSTARAVSLLGAEVLLTGVRAEVARTLVEHGLDLTQIATLSSLQTGLRRALRARR